MLYFSYNQLKCEPVKTCFMMIMRVQKKRKKKKDGIETGFNYHSVINPCG